MIRQLLTLLLVKVFICVSMFGCTIKDGQMYFDHPDNPELASQLDFVQFPSEHTNTRLSSFKLLPVDNQKVKSRITRKKVTKVILKNYLSFFECFEGALDINPELEGVINIDFLITKYGRVLIPLIQNSTIKNQFVQQCLVEQLKELKFPWLKKEEMLLVSYPFILQNTINPELVENTEKIGLYSYRLKKGMKNPKVIREGYSIFIGRFHDKIKEQHDDIVKACFQEEFDKNPQYSGIIEFKFKTRTGEKCTEVDIENSTFDNDKVDQCLLGFFKKTTMPSDDVKCNVKGHYKLYVTLERSEKHIFIKDILDIVGIRQTVKLSENKDNKKTAEAGKSKVTNHAQNSTGDETETNISNANETTKSAKTTKKDKKPEKHLFEHKGWYDSMTVVNFPSNIKKFNEIEIEETLNFAHPHLLKCYSAKDQTTAETIDNLIVEFNVRNNKKVSDLALVSSTINDKNVEQCMLEVLQSNDFKNYQGRKMASVKYPFTFANEAQSTKNLTDSKAKPLSEKDKIKTTFDAETIKTVMKNNLKPLKLCYDRELSSDPTINGKITPRISINSKGIVVDAEIEKSTVNNKRMEECVSAAIKEIAFPQFEGDDVVFVYPFHFNPSHKTANISSKIKGALDKKVIAKVIKSNYEPIRMCYQRELNHDPTLHGKISIKFKIGKDGLVTESSVKVSTMDNPSVELCVAEVIKEISFPQPKGGGFVVVTYPFIFHTQRLP